MINCWISEQFLEVLVKFKLKVKITLRKYNVKVQRLKIRGFKMTHKEI